MTAIAQALGANISPEKILEFFMKKNPRLKESIQSALSAGISAKKILGFIEKPENFEAVKQKIAGKSMNPEQLENPLVMAESLKRSGLQQDIASRTSRGLIEGAKTGAKYGATALGAYSLGRALPAIVQQLAPGMANGPVTPPPPTQPQAPQAPQAQQIPAPAQPNALPAPSPTIPAIDVLTQMNLKDKVDNLAKAGNSPEQITAAINISLTPGQKKWMSENKIGNLKDVVQEYAASQSQIPITESKKESITEPIETGTKSVGNPVQLPDGQIGKIESVKNGIAKINIDGEIKHRKLDEVDQPVFNEDEVADAYDNLMAKIPEQHRSSAIFWAGYDENTNTLGYIPHGGKYYEFSNISPEDAEKIKTEGGTARTSGETREGMWISGGSSRGSEIYKIVEKLRKEKEEADKRQLKFGFVEEMPKEKKAVSGMKPIHDILGYARSASQAREKRLKKEAKAKTKAEKQKEKDEEKARKKRKK